MPHRPARGKPGVLPVKYGLVLLLLGGCNHQDPFPDGDPTRNGPNSTTPPVRLTFNPGADQSPSFTSDGTTFLYSFGREGGPAPDRCLGVMPAEGGTRSITKCLIAPLNDSARALGPVAAGPAGQVAWVDARSLNGRKTPDVETLRIGTSASQDTGVIARSFPYPATSGNVHFTATSLAWLSATRLAYIGNDRFILGPCQACKPDTLIVAREAVLLDLSTLPATPAIIPNTSEVTSLFPSADGLSLYFTRANDSRVYQRVLASGAESTVHDFGGPIARDVNVRGSVLTAVVGGKVNYLVDPIIGARQVDSGGFLVRVDLATGDETPVPFALGVVQRPALSPDGRTVIAEGIDTLAPLRVADLWRIALP